MRRLPLALLPLAVVTGLLAGCGGGGGDGAEREVTELVEVSSRSTDLGSCRRYYTLDFLEQNTKLRGQAAVSACEEQLAEAAPADSVSVTKVRIDGDAGTAEVAYRGGAFDGQTVSYALAYADGAWKFDELTGFPVFDREAILRESARASYDRARTPAEREATACAVERLRELDDASLQEIFLSPSPQPLIEISQACESPSSSV